MGATRTVVAGCGGRVIGGREGRFRDGHRSAQEGAGLGQATPALVVAQETVVPDLDEARRQQVPWNWSWPSLPVGTITRLRIMQVLPKSTWHANDLPVGLASASPGRQVLGTVPVEADGSAAFRAPARVALAFQALDEWGQAVQTMRSITSLQPGEKSSCVGCHESRHSAPTHSTGLLALRRAPSEIEPGPDGLRPLSCPLLVQPVLDRHCVTCHNGERREVNVVLSESE